ncbi:hypothetical protein EYR40_003024 [Pleurotus pulmonarius]|nr:hypothetical protein EYR36_005472 [Pleurotus pulmonarius]KAF4580626.1 hypothetical protein EYR40_003024 [Pleurotus pulmonarius]
MVDKNPSTVSHLLGKRSDPQLTLGLAVGFGATALVLTAFISFLLGHYFGRRAALKSLGKDEGESSTQVAGNETAHLFAMLGCRFVYRWHWRCIKSRRCSKTSFQVAFG